MDYTELLFAAEVRKAAIDLYRTKRTEFIGNNPRGGAFEQQLASWEAEHPFEHWFAQAYSSIVWAAKCVRNMKPEE